MGIRKEKKHHNIKEFTGTEKEKKWCARLRLKDGKVKFGGYFNAELDAGKRVNQLCEDLGILPHNPGVVQMPTQHDDGKPIANPVIHAEILNIDNDDANKNKKKREQKFNDNPVKKPYFYAYLLK